MAAAVPVVISEHCHFAEIEKAGAGKVAPLDVGGLTDVLAELLEQPALCQQMGAKGRELVQTRFAWRDIAGQMIEVYEDVIRSSRKSRAWVHTGGGMPRYVG
jgi:glycosyltransferase involved in cell wall biosynthesis